MTRVLAQPDSSSHLSGRRRPPNLEDFTTARAIRAATIGRRLLRRGDGGPTPTATTGYVTVYNADDTMPPSAIGFSWR
jgi:hypothetical protein